VLLSQSPPRIPTLEQSQLAQNLHERLTCEPRKSCPLSSGASFTEDVSISSNKMNYRKHQVLDSVSASESMANVSGDSQMSQTSHSAIKLSASSVRNKGFQKLIKVSTQEKSLQRKDVNCCTCYEAPRVFTEDYCACLPAFSPSLNSPHKYDDSLHVTDKQESSDLQMVDAIFMASSDGITVSSRSGHIALLLDLQLQENLMVSEGSIMRLNW
jgi:hypothetical protein